jgi:hypothetical protein
MRDASAIIGGTQAFALTSATFLPVLEHRAVGARGLRELDPAVRPVDAHTNHLPPSDAGSVSARGCHGGV